MIYTRTAMRSWFFHTQRIMSLPIYLVIVVIRHFFVGAIYAGAENIYKMLYALGVVIIGVAAYFQNYVKHLLKITLKVSYQKALVF